MIVRHANRLMVAYLYLDRDAMSGTENKSTSAAPPHGVDANRRNHFRLAAGNVRSTSGRSRLISQTSGLRLPNL
jgi:hypothetical protein